MGCYQYTNGTQLFTYTRQCAWRAHSKFTRFAALIFVPREHTETQRRRAIKIHWPNFTAVYNYETLMCMKQQAYSLSSLAFIQTPRPTPPPNVQRYCVSTLCVHMVLWLSWIQWKHETMSLDGIQPWVELSLCLCDKKTVKIMVMWTFSSVALKWTLKVRGPFLRI